MTIADQYGDRSPGNAHFIVLPGGSYSGHAPHEAEPVAEWLTLLGVSASVFHYPVQSRHPVPVTAIKAEIARVKAALPSGARIGLLGFSAGGHAAAHAAYSPGESVDFLALAYPVISMIHDSHALSRSNLLGTDTPTADTEVPELVHSEAPPTFIWHTADDEAVPVSHSYLLARRLAQSQVPHELHVFPHGRHGLGLGDESEPSSQWRGLFQRWLADLLRPTAVSLPFRS